MLINIIDLWHFFIELIVNNIMKLQIKKKWVYWKIPQSKKKRTGANELNYSVQNSGDLQELSKKLNINLTSGKWTKKI